MNNKNLLKGTMVYSLSNIVTKMGSLIFLPIITRLLTKEEFGIVGTLGPIATLFAVVLGLGLYNAQMKKYIDLKDNEEELGSYMFSTAMIVIIFNILMYMFLFTPLAKKLFSYVLDLSKVNYNPLVIITVMIASINALNTLATTLFRMKKMYTKVAIGSLITVFTTYILTIIFIKNLKMGVFGNQFANLIAILLLLIYYFKDYFGKFTLKIKTEYIKYSIKNGLPLIFIELTDQIVNFSDRILIAKFSSFSQAGDYSLAYTGGQILSVVTSSFINSWTPEFYEAMKKDKTNPRITKSLEDFVALIAFVCVGAQLFAPEIIRIVFPASYENSINPISIILAGVVIRSLICLDYFFHYHEDSMYIFYFSVCALIFNVGGNLILIPKFPEYSLLIDAWTTLIAFLIRIVVEMIIINKKYKIKFNYKKLLMYFIIIINPIILVLGNKEISLIKFLIKIIYFGIVIKLLINGEVKEKVFNIIKKLKNKIIKR